VAWPNSLSAGPDSPALSCPPNRGHSNDHSRLAYAELLPTESPADCVAFLRRAASWYAEHNVTVERVLSDNGNGYRSHLWQTTCAELNIGRRYTRPRHPRPTARQKP
jgi:hypothetical protein